MQVSQKEKEAALQKRLDEITEELHKSQASYKTLQKEQQSSLAGEMYQHIIEYTKREELVLVSWQKFNHMCSSGLSAFKQELLF